MTSSKIALASVVFCLGMAGGCADDEKLDPRPTLYERMGEQPGVRAVVADFVDRVMADPAINGYFLHDGLDRGHLEMCLVKQIGAATGGPQTYPDPAAGCRDMPAAHAELGISQQDFDDLVDHFNAALRTAGLSSRDVETVTGVFDGYAEMIVEDPSNDATVYQRVGRKPAIAAVITAFIEEVVADDRINGFFATLDSTERLHTCLTRQVCGIDGPCQYGAEIEHPSEPGVSEDLPCRNMVDAHVGLTDGDSNPIDTAAFNALVEDLVTVLDEAGVTEADKNAILGALGPLCSDMVDDTENCGSSARRRGGVDATSGATERQR